MSLRPTFATILAGLVLAASACTTGRAVDRPAPADPSWPAGRTFLSTVVTVDGTPKPLVDGTRIQLAFADDATLSASAGCNAMGGDAHLEGSTLVVGNLISTDLACPGRGDQDAWLSQLLTDRPTLQLAGNELTLTRGTTVITLLDRTVADPDRPLAGTRWVVDTIFTGLVASSMSTAQPATLVLDPAGTFQATTGCAGGSLAGTWVLVGGGLALLATDNHPCTAASADRVDQAVRSVLSGPVTYQITADRLRLMGQDDNGLGLLAG